MYFKKLEIFGFKSFPDKIKIVFEPGITAVVGPNGSGKSNISDAIRWILGEQSARSLRGERMEDIIFAGTQSRKPLGFAEAFLTLDNSQGTFPIEFSELTVGRRLFRSGESEYYINKSPCRLKDIEELFMDTGLGKKAYSIIDQEKMGSMLSSAPEERRLLFEEAAGIMKYKVKKEEALRKLERTEQNLIRLNDIIVEVDRQLNSISRHFQKAQKYKKYKEELDGLEIQLGKNRYLGLHSSIEEKNKRRREINEKIEELSGKIKKEDADLQKLKQVLTGINTQISECQTQKIIKSKEIENLEDKIKFFEKHFSEIKEEEENDTFQLELLNQKEKEKEDELKRVLQELDNLTVEESKKEKELVDFEKNLLQISEEYKQDRKSLEELRIELFELVRTSSQIKNKLGIMATQFNEDLEQSLLSVYNRRTQLLSSLKFKEEELKKLVGDETLKDYFKGTQKISEVFKVNPEYSIAIHAAMAPYLQAVILENFSLGKQGLGIMEEKGLGRQKLVIIEKVPPEMNSEVPASISVKEGVLGKASQFVECEPEYQPIINYLLDKIIVVENFSRAEEILNDLTSPWQIVTLKGEVFEAPGVITGGSLKETLELATKENIITDLKLVIEDLKKKLEALENEEKERKEKIQASLEEEKNKLTSELKEKEDLTVKLEAELKHREESSIEKERELERQKESVLNLKIEIKAIKEKKSSHAFMVNYLEHSNKENDNSIDSRAKEAEKRREKRNALKSSIEDSKKQKELLGSELLKLNEEIEKINTEKQKLDSDLRSEEEAINSIKSDQIDFQRETHNLDIEIATLNTEITNLLERLKESHGVSIDKEEVIGEIENLEELKERVEFLKGRLQSMGPVNLVAIDEHTELEERSNFLKTQKEDLEKSKESLLKIIKEINQTTRVLFLETFSLIQGYFSEIFRSLFGGGNAKVVLQNEDDILESGIDIIASPPGKKLQNINLLSGGEKALTTMSLLFALFKVKPSPFCVLDEIDAALDESNVNRFCSLLKGLCDKSQFIVITHNKESIAASDVIYGVTMEEPGISKIVSVRLTEKKSEPVLTPEAVPSN